MYLAMEEGRLEVDQEKLLHEGIRLRRPSHEKWRIRGSNPGQALRQKATKRASTKKILTALAHLIARLRTWSDILVMVGGGGVCRGLSPVHFASAFAAEEALKLLPADCSSKSRDLKVISYARFAA